MKTYQDLLKVGERDDDRMSFVMQVINDHVSSEEHRIAADA